MVVQKDVRYDGKKLPPMTVSEFLEFELWARHEYPEVIQIDMVEDEKLPDGVRLVSGFTMWLEESTNIVGRPIQIAETYVAAKQGLCSVCFEQPACRAMRLSGHLFLGVCHTCYNSKG